MMKHEFEKLINATVSNEDYAKIETVYMTFDFMFKEKNDIAFFYITHGMDGIERMFAESKYINRLKSGNETKEMLIVNLDLEKVRFRRFRGLVLCEYLNLSEKSDLLKRKLAVCSNATSEINDIIKYVSELGDILDESAR